MEIEEFLENKMPKAIEYASHIILEENHFLKFSVALVDYMGADFIPYCKSVYVILRGLSYPNITFESDDELRAITSDNIRCAYNKFKKEIEKDREKEFKENIDELQFLVKSYRNSDEFRKLLDFVGRFRYLAPYNAMLVQMQKPGATFVFTGKKWFEYGRTPKVNAQKLITLKPFGPVQCMFDYSDTEASPDAKNPVTDSELMERWDKGLMQAKGEIHKDTLSTLYDNLKIYGIYLDDSFYAANTYGGYIMPYEDAILEIPISNGHRIQEKSRFVISVNRKVTDVVKFHTICHELGHLFCYHQSYDDSKKRKLSIKEREFEAETVAWLVCKRQGVDNPSEEYLAMYAPEGEIPVCSTDYIMRAVTEIEKMLKGKINIKDSTWYKEDKALKQRISEFGKSKLSQLSLFETINE